MSRLSSQPNWPDLAGRMDGRIHVLPVRIYFEDTDFSGSVYHTGYLRFCERGRSDFLRLAGIHHNELYEQGSLVFAVRHIEADFLKPASIDNILEVRTSLREMRGARFVIDQEILRSGDAIYRQNATIALLSRNGRPHRITENLRKKFEPYL